MRDVQGKAAFITGGASGIGFGMAQAFLAAGRKVVIADIRTDALRQAETALRDEGEIATLRLDVTDRNDWTRAVDEAERAFGPVHLLCSNAGVNIVGPLQEATYEDWDFCLGVNLGGAVNAVRTVAPRMLARGEGGHVVITSSVNGVSTGPGVGVYATSKYALVGLAESLRADLRGHGIGVSVLCPGPVRSALFESTVEVRPPALSATGSVPVVPPGVSREATPIFATAMTPLEVGQRVLAGVRRNDLYILTHAEIGVMLKARSDALLAALPDDVVDPARVEAGRPLLDTTLYTEAAGGPRAA